MKVFALKIIITLFNLVYFCFKPLKTKNKIVMISRQSNTPSNDFLLLGNELEKHNITVIYLCKTLDGGANASFFIRCNYGFHMFIQMYHLATSKVCILDGYSPVVSILKHKNSLKIVQIWHSIGNLKSFGWQIIGKEEGSSLSIAKTMKMHKNYDIIYCAGEAYTHVLLEGFNATPDKIRIFTLPRVDLLTSSEYTVKTRTAIMSAYPQLAEKPNVIYAPTFRKNEVGFVHALQNLIDAFDFEKYNLIVKLHPLSTISLCDERIIFDRQFSTFQMLTCADKFISDYSCMIYEAGIKEIPIYFYNYDIGIYESSRGLTIDYNDLPGFKSSDAKTLVQYLEESYNYEELSNYINKTIDNIENCTKKMAADILSMCV